MEIHSSTLKVRRGFLLVIVISLIAPAWGASNFFEISDVSSHLKPGRTGAGVWIVGDPLKDQPDVFIPCVEAKLSTAQQTRSKNLVIKAYFFDEEQKLVMPAVRPAAARRSSVAKDVYDLPILFPEKETESIFFIIPKELEEKKWRCVVMFGDKQETEAKAYPKNSLIGLEFPEKERAQAIADPNIERKAALDPVIEHVVQTRNPKHPQITLLLRPPDGITDTSEIQGVMAMCMLAPNVDSIRRSLQVENSELSGLLAFADKHKLAVLCWGARTIWRADANYDDLERETAKALDRDFDDVAKAWDHGVDQLQKKYGLPKDNYLLWGICASAQWAHRLALRKPDRFLAAYIHIPSSFDKPTPDGAKILWLLTTGELDAGYKRAIRWYQDCREAGYPMIYKPIIGLGHAGSPIADDLGMKFFEYALTLREDRRALDEHWKDVLEERKKGEAVLPWPDSFRKPAFVGDFFNQEVFPFNQETKIPTAFRVPLPTKVLADAWHK